MSETAFIIKHIAPRARRYWRRLPRKQQVAVNDALNYLTISPFEHPNPTTIKPMKGKRRNTWRYRVGSIRIIYYVEDHEISIIAIGQRGDVY